MSQQASSPEVQVKEEVEDEVVMTQSNSAQRLSFGLVTNWITLKQEQIEQYLLQCRRSKRVKNNSDCNCDECMGRVFVIGEDEDDGGELLETDDDDDEETVNTAVNAQTNDILPASQSAVSKRRYHFEQPRQCPFEGCHRMFKLRSSYCGHLAVHSGRYTCSQCGQLCSNNYNLTSHQLKHSGTKPYQCPQCPLAFARKPNLTVHQRTHSGEKPFKCTHCEKSFAQSSDLTKHLRTHTGEKPYKCTHCSYASAQKGALTSHLHLHTGQLLFQCEQCSKRFNRKGYLTKHMRNKH